MTFLLGTLLGIGLVASGWYLLGHRPTAWFSYAAMNSSGWVLILFLSYLRSGILLAVRGHAVDHGPLDTAISLGLLAAIDLLVLARLISWLRYRNRFTESFQDRSGAETPAPTE
jgi:hypothetical protein